MTVDDPAERALLGAILIDPAAYWVARSSLGPEHFVSGVAAVVFEAMGLVLGRGSPLDVATLSAALRESGKLNTLGGAGTLVDLTADVATTAHVEAHARIIRESAQARAIARGAAALAAQAQAGAPLAALQGDARRLLEASTTSTAGELVSIGQGAEEEFKRLTSDVPQGVQSSGLGCLDRALAGGWWQGQMVVIGARPSVGKSALGLLAALIAALECQTFGGCVFLVSVEMPAADLAARAACILAYLKDPHLPPIDLMQVRARSLSPEDSARYIDALQALPALPLHLTERSDLTPTQGRALALQLRARCGRVNLVVWDYLQATAPDRRHESREREVAETAATLKNMARELKCPVLALSQLNRKATERPPTLADLRESGAIEQDADVVLLLHREGSTRTIDIAKQRNGAISDAPMPVGWIGPSALFVDPPEDWTASRAPASNDPPAHWNDESEAA